VKVLVANVGSTSLMYQLLDMAEEAVLARGATEIFAMVERAEVEAHATIRDRTEPCQVPEVLRDG
jgi:acetate kinase